MLLLKKKSWQRNGVGILLTVLINAFSQRPQGHPGIHPRLPFLWIPLIPGRTGVILPPRHTVTLRVALRGYNRGLLAGPDHQLLFQVFWGPRGKGILPMSRDRKQQRKARRVSRVRITAAIGLVKTRGSPLFPREPLQGGAVQCGAEPMYTPGPGAGVQSDTDDLNEWKNGVKPPPLKPASGPCTLHSCLRNPGPAVLERPAVPG